MLYLMLHVLLLSSIWIISGEGSVHYKNEFLLCRKCGADIADSAYIFNKISPGAKKVVNHNLFGKTNVTIQTLVNPLGVKFDILTTEKAHCYNVGERYSAESWFPGYTWRVCPCPHCWEHLGWVFEKFPAKYDESNSFHGLILGNILGEHFTNFLVVPKMYRV